MNERILLVDDEPYILGSLQRLLRQALRDPGGRVYRIEAFTSAEAALFRAREVVFALAVSDYRMPGCNGVDFLRALRDLQPDCERIVLSGYADLKLLVTAINEAGISRFIPKPWTDFELVSAIQQSLSKRTLALENQRLADEMRVQRGSFDIAEVERRRLERLEPGITQVQWSEDGSFILEDPGDVAL